MGVFIFRGSRSNGHLSEQQRRIHQRLPLRQLPEEIPDVIYKANIPNLRISVGSEMALMLRPGDCWVTNIRTLFAHFVLHHSGDYDMARELLGLCRGPDEDLQIGWEEWRSLHPEVGASLSNIGILGNEGARKQLVRPGTLKFLWADAIADNLYANYG